MKNLRVLVALMFIVGLLAASPAAAGQGRGQGQADSNGGFKLTVHTHSHDDPDWPGLLFETDRLAYDFEVGDDFAYSSRTCDGPAPFNDVGLNFRPDYPGVDDDDGTAAVRHLAEGEVTEVNGDRGTIEGTITSVLCVTENGQQTESEHQIVSHYEARYHQVSENRIQLRGHFEISPTDSTGTFEDLTGHGSLQANLLCLAHQRNPEAPSCAERGHFTDFVGLRGDITRPPGETTPGLVGTYSDPTVTTD